MATLTGGTNLLNLAERKVDEKKKLPTNYATNYNGKQFQVPNDWK